MYKYADCVCVHVNIHVDYMTCMHNATCSSHSFQTLVKKGRQKMTPCRASERKSPVAAKTNQIQR